MKRQYRWKPEPTFWGLFIYIVASLSTVWITKLDKTLRGFSGFIILVMVVFLVVCMATERGQWRVWQRVGFVPLGWLAEAVICFPVWLLITSHLPLGGFRDETTTLLSGLAVVLYAMRRSRLFVELHDH